jgi:peptidoglycan hydrolase-like protein with peptidoglycan-binding domain
MNDTILKKWLSLTVIAALFLGFMIFSLYSHPQKAAAAMITTSLDIGSRGADVTSLQTFLAMDPTIYPQGLITGYYGSLTAAAVRNFQARYGIQVVGRVGPITRAKINELMLSGGWPGGGVVTTDGAPFIFQTSALVTTGSGTATSTNTGDTSRRATISWQTNENARGKVFYSTSPLTFSESMSQTTEPSISGSVQVDDTYTTSKSMTISNLSNNVIYYYMIEAIDANGNVSVTWPTLVQTM